MSGKDEKPKSKIKGPFSGVVPKDLVHARVWLEYRLRHSPDGGTPSLPFRRVIATILSMIKAVERNIREDPIIIGDYWDERKG